MKKILLTILALLVLQLGAYAQSTIQKLLQSAVQVRKPIIMAHRMAPTKGYAENSLRTLAYNLEKYPNVMQEIDVRLTSDGIAVINHDPTLDRTSTGSGDLNRYTYHDLQQLQLKDDYGTLLNDRIPTLQAVLKLIKKKNATVMLDMKPGTHPDIMMKIVNATQTEGNAVVICYSLKEGIDFHQKYPHIMIALGFNSPEIIAAIYKSSLPLNLLIALTPKGFQSKSYYTAITNKKIPISFSAQGDIDQSIDAVNSYKKAFELGGTIICTDSLKKIINNY